MSFPGPYPPRSRAGVPSRPSRPGRGRRRHSGDGTSPPDRGKAQRRSRSRKKRRDQVMHTPTAIRGRSRGACERMGDVSAEPRWLTSVFVGLARMRRSAPSEPRLAPRSRPTVSGRTMARPRARSPKPREPSFRRRRLLDLRGCRNHRRPHPSGFAEPRPSRLHPGPRRGHALTDRDRVDDVPGQASTSSATLRQPTSSVNAHPSRATPMQARRAAAIPPSSGSPARARSYGSRSGG
jgi:hypothetical protein